MAYLEKQLYIKKSTLPGAGKGLFTKVFIPKGKRIVEYRGQILTWKAAEKMADDRNGYVFYITAKHVIDAWPVKKELARYANDAKGLNRLKGHTTNSEYMVDKKRKRCYITAIKDIAPGSEIFVEYGAEYWQAIRYNIRLERNNKAKKGKGAQKAAKRQSSH